MAAFTPTRPLRATFDIRTSPTTGMAFVVPWVDSNGDESSYINGESEADSFDFSARFSEADQPWSPAPMSSADELFCNGQIRPLWFTSHEEEEFNHSAAKLSIPHEDGNHFDFRSSANWLRKEGPIARGNVEKLNANGHKLRPNELKLRPNEPRLRPNEPKLRPNELKLTPNEPKLTPNDPKLSPNEHRLQTTDVADAMVKVEARGRRGRKEGGGHRRNRSLSPVRVFHMDDDLPRQSFQTDQSFHSAQTDDVQQDRKANKVHWTLENLLHQAESHKKQQKASEQKHTKASMVNREIKRSGLRLSPINRSPRHDLDKIREFNYPPRSPNHHSKLQPLSPHELHYASHKAQSEQMRRRTFLPYRHGLLGCLGFTPKSYRSVSGIQTFHSKP